MTDTQMSWLHILFKDRGSTFIVILNTFLEGKLFLFFYGEAEPVKKMESVICCCKYHGTNVLRIALRINLLFLFTWFLVTFSFIYTCLAPLSTIILCQPNRPWKHCNSLPVQAKHSTPKLPTVGLLATRLCIMA